VVVVIGVVLLAAVVINWSLPYWVVPAFLVGWLAGQHVSSPRTSAFSRRWVVVATVWATALASALPLATIPAVVTLTAVGAYILLHRSLGSSE
jgi:hypothetical protein